MNSTLKKITFCLGLCLLLIIGGVWAQEEDRPKEEKKIATKDKQKTAVSDQSKNGSEETIVLHNEIIVTATRSEKTVFNVPKPVSVVSRENLEKKGANNISELFPEMPGTDMVGVGANQSRPVIRGLRGQRILLLSDGIRMSNSRRTQSFGEIPGLFDITGMEKVEVVRGPASVLYGSEAIGGVVNIISRTPFYSQPGTGFSGDLGYRFSSADSQHKGFVNLQGHVNNFGFMLSGSYRNVDNYQAPAGTFGNITLDKETPVLDSGVIDNNIQLYVGYRFSESNDLSFKFESYKAQDAGFGYVDPALYSQGDPTIQLLYPDQNMRKFTLKYENRALNLPFANGITFTAYQTKNERTFDTNISMSFFPGAGMNILSSNFTDVNTFGTRIELTKVLWNKHIFTYGLDFFQDDSKNTDINTTEMFGFGPPMVQVDNISKVPNANFRSLGLFIQDEISLFPRATFVLGLRYQSIQAKTKETEGISEPLVDSQDSTFVASSNFIYGLTENLNLILSLGRGFRSPNLPERFYQGITPNGSEYQIRNPELGPETSFNVDLGLRYRLGGFFIETTFFRNMVQNGIQVAPTGDTIGRLVVYKNINVDRLRLQGAELQTQWSSDFGISLLASFSHITSRNLANPELMYADTYGTRYNFNIHYNFPNELFWVEYHIRHNSDQKNIDLGNNPIGSIIPGFTVHSFRAGLNLFKGSAFAQQIGIVVGNLTNALYSEFSNASFFRPAPKRHVVLTWSTQF